MVVCEVPGGRGHMEGSHEVLASRRGRMSARGERGQKGGRKEGISAGEERGRRTSLKNLPGQEKIHEAKNSICHFVCDGGARRQHVTRHIRRTKRTGILGYISSDI